MQLNHAKKLLKEKTEQKFMQTYAVLVSVNGEEGLITSPDADKDTYFDIASVGKVVVTTQLALKAMSENKLSLTDTLEKFFENVPEEKKGITIKQLLTHTSGIRRYPISEETCARNNDVIAEDILSHPLDFEPGTAYLYSCAGMMLVGYILEKIYQMTLDELFFVKIKHPLGIDRMRFNIAIDEKNAAVCYQRKEVGLRRMDDWTVVLLRNGVSGAGGSFWSINAFNTLVKAILNKDERLYSQEQFELAEQKHFGDYGLGYEFDVLKGDVNLGDLFPKGSFGHTGWTGCAFFINREKNMYAIVLSNTRRCLEQNFGQSFDENGRDLVYVHIQDVFNAIKQDLDEQNILADSKNESNTCKR